jgi:hypothetical protein
VHLTSSKDLTDFRSGHHYYNMWTSPSSAASTRHPLPVFQPHFKTPVQSRDLLPCFDDVDPSLLQSVFANRCGLSTTNPQQAHAFPRIPPGTFLDHESVPVVADLEANAQFGEDDSGAGSNLAEIAGQLPATTFWAFACEFFGKVPELFLR